MPTQTSTAAASGVAPKAVHAGVNSLSITKQQSPCEASATTFLMGKIPSGATILDVIHKTSYPGGTAATDIGITTEAASSGTESLSAFTSALAKNTQGRATLGVPYSVDPSQTVTAGYETVKVTVTAATATTSLIINTTVLYTMD
tara:strand:- start:3192 stop:3626 length:435 start_codon:yes stop_codon:yes gene_type:complete